MPGFPVLHHLLELAQTHVHWVVMPSNYLILCHPLLLLPSIFPSVGSFPISRLFASGGQSIGASASVLPMNIQGWFPLGLTGLISLLSKGLPWILKVAIQPTDVGNHLLCLRLRRACTSDLQTLFISLELEFRSKQCWQRPFKHTLRW